MWESTSYHKDGHQIIQIKVPKYDYYYFNKPYDDWYDAIEQIVNMLKKAIEKRIRREVCVHYYFDNYYGRSEFCIDCDDKIIGYYIAIEPSRQQFEEAFLIELIEDFIKRVQGGRKPHIEYKELKPLQCSCCGGTIDFQTLTCKFCGMQYYLGEGELK